jgi:hypothetical protein
MNPVRLDRPELRARLGDAVPPDVLDALADVYEAASLAAMKTARERKGGHPAPPQGDAS